MALAFGLRREIAMPDPIVTISFAVVAFSVVVQGLSMTPLLKGVGEI